MEQQLLSQGNSTQQAVLGALLMRTRLLLLECECSRFLMG
jgi:hypothetical protein